MATPKSKWSSFPLQKMAIWGVKKCALHFQTQPCWSPELGSSLKQLCWVSWWHEHAKSIEELDITERLSCQVNYWQKQWDASLGTGLPVASYLCRGRMGEIGEVTSFGSTTLAI